MTNLKKKITAQRVISAATIGVLLIALQATGVLGGFWRTLDGITSGSNPSSYEYGYGYGDLGWGYGYGYGYEAQASAGASVNTTTTSTVAPSGSTTATAEIPSGTTITSSTDATIGSIVSGNITAPSGTLEAMEIYAKDASGTRISNTVLYFSKPVKVDFGLSGTSMTAKVKHYGDSAYNFVGLTTNPSATCTNGVPSTTYAGAVITNGIIYTCSASSFSATAVSSSSSSGGGGGGSSTPTCIDTNLECKESSDGTYKLYKKDGVSCRNGNLGKTCVLTTEETTSTGTTTETEEEVTVEDSNATLTYNLEGEISEANGVATLNSCQFAIQPHTFLDDEDTFATQYITVLQELGIVNGRDGNGKLFMPESNTTRTEFLKMTLRVFCKDYSGADTSGLPYADVSKSDWKANVVAKALSEGYITAANANFRPDDAISRIEAIKILTLAAGMSVEETDSTVFTDVSVDWMKKYVEVARTAGIVNGQEVNGNLIFEPNRNITRAEASKVIIKGVKAQ